MTSVRKLIMMLGVAAALSATPAARAGFLRVDPAGDTFVFGVGPDIITYEGRITGPGVVAFSAEFAAAISAPSSFAPNSVYGFIDLDTDKNAGTGATSWTT